MRYSIILKLLCTFALLSTSLSADSLDWKTLANAEKFGKFPPLKPIKLVYKGTFNNLITAGRASFIYNRQDQRYKNYYLSQCYGKSTTPLVPYVFDMTSFASKKTLMPRILVANEKDDKESDFIKNNFTSSSVKHSKVTKSIKSGKTLKTKSSKYSGIAMHDILTGMMFIRSQDLSPGKKFHLCVHPFATPYFCTVTVLKKEQMQGKNAIKMDVALRKVDSKTGALLPYKKMKKATIWVSDDSLRIPLEFRVEVKLANKLKIGSVRLTLEKTEYL